MLCIEAWQEKYELQQLLQQQQQSTELQYNRNNNLTIDLPILLSSIDDEVSKKLTSPKNNMKPYGTIDYNGIEGEGKILATKGNVQSKYNSDANMCVTISNNTDGNNYSNSQSHSHFNSNKSPTNRVSLTEFARAGNLSAAKHLFDLEV